MSRSALVTEEAVKEALQIDSFRNLSKDKIMQFASMIPNMDSLMLYLSTKQTEKN